MPKLKVAKFESYQSWKWFLYFLLKIKLTVLMNWIESCQNWNLPSLKVTNFESRQSWKLTKLKVSSAFLAESCQNAKLPNCQDAKLPNCKVAKLPNCKFAIASC